MDVEYVMTTFVDDGLVDVISDSPDSPLAIDESRVIDLNDINAAIEDPGYIVEEPTEGSKETEKYAVIEDPGYILDEPTESSIVTEKCTSSYGKRSFTLPVSFFDNSSNIRLLTQCRPIIISIVDCELYPWYYEKYRRTSNLRIDTKADQQKKLSVKDEPFNEQQISEVLELKHGEIKKAEAFSTKQCNFSGIELSPEQSLAVLKLKEKIKYDIAKSFTGINDGKTSNITPTKNNRKETPEKQNNNNVSQHDLLAYCKAIAQSIVRNDDHGEINCKINNLTAVEDYRIVNTNNSFIHHAERSASVQNTATPNKYEAKETANEKVITSPILPCNLKQKKKSKSKRNVNQETTITNNNLENSSNLKNCCDRLTSSTHRVIPHYHSLPLPPGPAGFMDHQSQHMDPNHLMSHYGIRSEIMTQQTMDEMRWLNANNSRNWNPQNTFVPATNYFSGPPPIYFEPQSYYSNFTNNFPQNIPPLSSISQDNHKKDVQSFFSARHPNNFGYHYNYADALSLNGCSRQITQKSENKNASTAGTNVDKFNHFMSSGLSNYNSTVVPSLPKQNVIVPGRFKTPERMTAANPLLTQMLNQSATPQRLPRAHQQYNDRNNYLSTTSNILCSENINVHQHFYPTLVTTVPKEPIVELKLRKENSVPLTNKKSIKIIAFRKNRKSKDASLKNKLNSNSKPNTPDNVQINKGTPVNTKISKGDDYVIIPSRINNPDPNRIMDMRPFPVGDKINSFDSLTSVQPTDKSVIDFKPSVKVPFRTNCYSPAILPIPTFTKSLEMLSDLQKNSDSKIISNIKVNQITSKKEEANLTRKRKQCDNNDVRIKKISLQEYKQRIDSGNVNTVETLNSDSYFNKKEEIRDKAVHDGTLNGDTLTDLGYDSDTTVILDTLN